MRTYDEHKNFFKKFINLFGQYGVCKEKRTYIPQSNSDCRRPTKLTPPPPPPPPSSSSSSSGENFSMIIPSIKEKAWWVVQGRHRAQRPLIGGLFGVRDSKST
jgi:hypothetical protein